MLKKLLWMFAVVLATATPLAAHAAVDVNKADQATLETVKGIGPGVSTRILDERKKAPFKDWGDLVDRVKGVGEGNAARFSKEGLTVNGSTFTPSENAGKADKKGKYGKAADKPGDKKETKS
ncbi:MAG: helix-hairpin-helix domain-containing protein [Rhizobacter sp.]